MTCTDARTANHRNADSGQPLPTAARGNDDMVPAAVTGRPVMGALDAELYDTWLIPNGFVGWIPEDAIVTVVTGPTVSAVTCPMWRHLSTESSPWDNDAMTAGDLIEPPIGINSEDNTVLTDLHTRVLKVPVTDRVRELFTLTGLTLIER